MKGRVRVRKHIGFSHHDIASRFSRCREKDRLRARTACYNVQYFDVKYFKSIQRVVSRLQEEVGRRFFTGRKKAVANGRHYLIASRKTMDGGGPLKTRMNEGGSETWFRRLFASIFGRAKSDPPPEQWTIRISKNDVRIYKITTKKSTISLISLFFPEVISSAFLNKDTVYKLCAARA